jgi:hypothetical protein
VNTATTQRSAAAVIDTDGNLAPSNVAVIDQKTGEILNKPTNASVTPGHLIQYAMAAGDKDLDRMERLMKLQIDWEAHEAEKAFNDDFAKVKTEPMVAERGRKVTDGPLKGKRYAELADVCDAVTESLAKYGFGHSWNVLADEKDWIKIECVITHRLGHKRAVAFGGAPDTGPGRNTIQARKSTVTYLERITLLLATGVAEEGTDDDGAGGKRDTGDADRRDAETTQRKLDELIAALAKVTTDENAVKLWNDGKKIMANTGDRDAYDKFKVAVATHRTGLREIAEKKAGAGK